MALVNFSNVDFDQIKQSIKDYLKANSNFTDYDFEGSNLSTIIDVLAYNTYINSYNANMVTNEVFIDSATLRNNVVSLARNVGYVPTSRKASKATISFIVDMQNVSASTLTLKSGLVAISANRALNQNLTFCIPSDVTVQVDSTGTANFENLEIYEGSFIQQNYTYSSRNPNQKYLLPNAGVDTDLVSVVVKESEQSTVSRKFRRSDSLLGVDGTSPVYYLSEIDGERYEVYFGDGNFGLPLQDPNYIQISYITSSGASGNGVTRFSYAGSLVDNNGNSVTAGVSNITTISPSGGGSDIESVESVRKYAPQIYSSQNRAVTSADYEAIIPQIYPEAESVSAFGGEDLSPPAYGKVFVSIKPYNGIFLSSGVKENIQNQIRKYSVAGIVVEIVDMKYLYVETNSTVYYNTNLATSPQQLSTVIQGNLGVYANSTELNKFGARFKYSKFQGVIDNSNDSITSNITTVNMRRDMVPVINAFAEYEICYGNRFHIKNHGHSPVADGTVIGYNIKSSGFTISGVNGTVYLGDTPNPDQKTGTLFFFRLQSPTEPVIVKSNVGLIDYIKGEVRLNPVNILSTQVNRGVPLIEISATPYSNDVIGLQDLYLQLDTSNVVVNMLQDNIASGSDTSGVNYPVTTSYSNGGLVRGTPVINTSITGTVQTTGTTSASVVTTQSGSSYQATY